MVSIDEIILTATRTLTTLMDIPTSRYPNMKSLIDRSLPPFDLHAFHDHDLIDISDRDLLDRWSVLFFYPADFTFVCPTELEDLAEHQDAFDALGVSVYAVSCDTHFAHMAWHAQSPAVGKVKFPMIGDPKGELARALGVYDKHTGLAHRGTFVFDPNGEIRLYEVHDDGIGRNAKELLRKIRAAQYVAEHPDEACPARWDEGADTLKPSADLVGKL